VTGFLDDLALRSATWQAFERLVARYLFARGFDSVRVVGGSGDGGADVIATINEKRWLVQAKKWDRPVGEEVLDETLKAARTYGAEMAVVASKQGFTQSVHDRLHRDSFGGIAVQLWDVPRLVELGNRLPTEAPAEGRPDDYALRPYQEDAVQAVFREWDSDSSGRAMVVMATGLGKTFVAASVIRRIANLRPGLRVLVLAHTNPLLRQLEIAFWPFLRKDEATLVANSEEKFDWAMLGHISYVFASRDTFDWRVKAGGELPKFDLVLVDECHHLGTESYGRVLERLDVGSADGPFMLGLTATDWRPDGESLRPLLGEPVIRVDLVQGLKSGFLTNVDYRMYTDNIDWDSLREDRGGRYSPKAINRSLFVKEWDDAVVGHIRDAWREIQNPRGIVFCSTIEHAKKLAAQISAEEFTKAEAIYSGHGLLPVERNKRLWDFSDGRIGILCAVDVLNEGVDVPDVNLVVFQRVTHSRRIFVQQLGRGLRRAYGKDKVVVLDFVNDVRRFAAGLHLQGELEGDGPRVGSPETISVGSTVGFRRANSSDVEGANFLREWLGDVGALEDAGEDVSILEFPNPRLVPER
jgi:superfamily II DNA or RNA helicase/Holliday junction resolvase